MIRPFPQFLAGLLALVCLASCVTLLPSAKPVRLYRFGVDSMPTREQDVSEHRSLVRLAQTRFEDAASGDRLLTSRGNEIAYIGNARWVSPASELFDDAVRVSFRDHKGVRLLGQGEPRVADYILALDVERFEARYADASNAAPTVKVSFRASLNPESSGAPTKSLVFSEEASASSNTVGAITQAFDVAVTKTLLRMANWVEQNAQR